MGFGRHTGRYRQAPTDRYGTVGPTHRSKKTVHSITPSEVAKSDGNGAMVMSRAAGSSG
jgi:hypothetical protein